MTTFIIAREEAPRWPFTVGWIDVFPRQEPGRGIIMLAAGPIRKKHSRAPEAAPRAGTPLELPSWSINRLTTRLFNAAYFLKHWQSTRRGAGTRRASTRSTPSVIGTAPMASGMTQHQCVLPNDSFPKRRWSS